VFIFICLFGGGYRYQLWLSMTPSLRKLSFESWLFFFALGR